MTTNAMATAPAPSTTQNLTSHLAQVFAQYPIEIAHGDGVWLHSRDGRKILDFYGGHAVAGLGYGHPRWLAALERQARQMAFQTNALPMLIRERAAARLAKFVGLGFDTVFWINSGAEANENALKLAFRLTGRRKIVALEQGFHGRTAAAGAVTWGAVEKWYGFPRAPFDVAFAPRDNPAAVDTFVDRETAAVIVEPVQGVGGAYDVGKPMLQALRQRCDDVGALLIFDEVQCGVGRTGAPFAANFYDVTPDMITCAKALGNGFPVSALLLGRRVSSQLKVDDMGTTFGGGPMACAVVEAVIDTIESESLLANVRQVSTYIRSSCIIGPVTGIQGAGFLLGLKTSRPAKEVQAALLTKNILTGTSGDPHILRLLPAYILNEGHVDQLSDALAKISA
jgi:acetylornithine/succinyldiaminopimelate/putrescine aminotransferase